jgi:hypothetical protein
VTACMHIAQQNANAIPCQVVRIATSSGRNCRCGVCFAVRAFRIVASYFEKKVWVGKTRDQNLAWH